MNELIAELKEKAEGIDTDSFELVAPSLEMCGHCCLLGGGGNGAENQV
jgi:hypothetical protein